MEASRDNGDDEAWSAAHAVLQRSLGLPLWEYPASDYPDDRCQYPEGATQRSLEKPNAERNRSRPALYHESRRQRRCR